jgi:hypothetical protein
VTPAAARSTRAAARREIGAQTIGEK